MYTTYSQLLWGYGNMGNSLDRIRNDINIASLTWLVVTMQCIRYAKSLCMKVSRYKKVPSEKFWYSNLKRKQQLFQFSTKKSPQIWTVKQATINRVRALFKTLLFTVYSNSNAQCYALSFMTLIYDSYSQLSILSMSTVHTCVSSHIGLKNRPFYKWALFSHTQSKTTFDIVYSTLFQFSSCACSVWNSGSLPFFAADRKKKF